MAEIEGGSTLARIVELEKWEQVGPHASEAQRKSTEAEQQPNDG
jgi:hypothetical protein